MSRLPNLNPIVVGTAYCNTCGNKLEVELDVFGKNKRVQGAWYTCINPEVGCNYRVYSDQRLTGQTVPVPAEKKA